MLNWDPTKVPNETNCTRVVSKYTKTRIWRAECQVMKDRGTYIVHDSLAVASMRATADYAPARRSCAYVITMRGPTGYSAAKEPSLLTLYQRSAQVLGPLDFSHVAAEEYESRKCIWTAAASCDAELDRGDGICMAIPGPPNIYLPGPIIGGCTVVA